MTTIQLIREQIMSLNKVTPFAIDGQPNTIKARFAHRDLINYYERKLKVELSKNK